MHGGGAAESRVPPLALSPLPAFAGEGNGVLAMPAVAVLAMLGPG